MKRIKSFNNTYPVLYLIATPIGNLGEFSPRAIEVINEMDLIAAEDTRNTLDLLHKFNIKKPCISLREHNEVEASYNLIKEIKNGKKIAYMSDAGYPGISDPGYLLTKLCVENDIAVSVISGSSAFINALVSSGLDTSHFYFHGFLSAKENEAKNVISILDKKVRDMYNIYSKDIKLEGFLTLEDDLKNQRKLMKKSNPFFKNYF